MADTIDNANMSQQEKHIFMTEKLQKRDDLRKSEIQKKKEDNEAPVREKCEHFHSNLNREIEIIESEIEKSSSKTKEELNDHFDGITVRLHTSQKFLSESILFLPPYDISRATDSLAKLQNALQEKRNDLLPKKKFAFKSKKAIEGNDRKTKKKLTKDVVDKVLLKDESYTLADCKFVNEVDQKLTKEPAEINHKDIALAGLRRCIVKLFGAPSAIHMNKLEDCQIFCGPVSGSIFIRECVNCVFVLSCQQLRIHNSKFTNCYIHVTSKAIIEDSSDIKFAPYNWNYPSIDEHFKLSGLKRECNNWNDIDDFNWLVSDTHSPNWSIINPEKQVKTWTT